jgi:hypothetical protein
LDQRHRSRCATQFSKSFENRSRANKGSSTDIAVDITGKHEALSDMNTSLRNSTRKVRVIVVDP